MRYRIYRFVGSMSLLPTTFVSKDKEVLNRMLFTLNKAKYGTYIIREDLEDNRNVSTQNKNRNL